MKTASLVTLAALVGLSLVSGAEARPRVHTTAQAAQTQAQPSLFDFSARANDRAVRVNATQDSEAWEGAGVGGNPNGN